MSASEFQRITGAMTALGWGYGTHRLYDLGRTGRSARMGFARGNADEQRTNGSPSAPKGHPHSSGRKRTYRRKWPVLTALRYLHRVT